MMKDFKLAEIFCDKMILQRDIDISIYGEAYRDIELTVELLETKVTYKISKGKFRVEFPAQKATWSTELKVYSENQCECFSSVAIGEVWVAGGQSNMAMYLKDTEAYLKGEPVKESEYIRYYSLGRNLFPNISDYREGYDWVYNKDMAWEVCNENTAPLFSAIGYYFAQILQEQLQVPIGIINCTVGGSNVFCWLPKEIILQDDRINQVYYDYENMIKDIDYKKTEDAYYQYLDSVKAEWYKEEEKDKYGYEVPAVYYKERGHFSFENPATLYKSMSYKIEHFTARGMIWYQGENDATACRSHIYKYGMDALVKYYATQSLNKDYKFCYVQLAPWNEPAATDWQGICNAQREFYLDNPGYPMVTTGDCGAGTDIHPPRKYPVAQRLANAALTIAYNRKAEFTGPIAKDCKYENNMIKIRFIHAEGLYLEDEDYIEMVYSDEKVVKSKIYIENNCVVLKDVKEKPLYLRYGWEPDYKIKLYNGSNIPASVFKIKV